MKNKCLSLLITIFILLIIVSCSKDDKGSSSTTGIDFTTREYMNDLDYCIFVDSDIEEGSIDILSKNDVINCEFKINDILINTSNWEEEEDLDDYFSWRCNIFFDDLPENIEMIQGSSHDFSLLINGENFSENITIPYKPIVDYPTFDLQNDFSFTWVLPEDPITQLIWFSCGNDFRNSVFKVWQIEGAIRTFTITKDIYSDFIETGLTDLDIAVDASNYKDLGTCVIVAFNIGNEFSSGYKTKRTSKNDLVKYFINLIKGQ